MTAAEEGYHEGDSSDSQKNSTHAGRVREQVFDFKAHTRGRDDVWRLQRQNEESYVTEVRSRKTRRETRSKKITTEKRQKVGANMFED